MTDSRTFPTGSLAELVKLSQRMMLFSSSKNENAVSIAGFIGTGFEAKLGPLENKRA